MEVDLVYCWVDGADPRHQASRSKYEPSTPTLVDQATALRFRSNGEIYASIRSALKFAPWLRKIWVVIDDVQLDRFHYPDMSKIALVPHSTIFRAVKHHLPTFNSHAIESQLCNIPGLSECFLYANDDTFFGAPCVVEDFFDGQKPRVFLSKQPLPLSVPPTALAWLHARANNNNLLRKYYPQAVNYHVEHHIRAFSQTLFRKAMSNGELANLLNETSRARFRSPRDVEPIGLMMLYGLHSGAVVLGNVSTRYFGVKDGTNFEQVARLLRERPVKLFCLNDGFDQPSEQQVNAYHRLLTEQLP